MLPANSSHSLLAAKVLGELTGIATQNAHPPFFARALYLLAPADRARPSDHRLYYVCLTAAIFHRAFEGSS